MNHKLNTVKSVPGGEQAAWEGDHQNDQQEAAPGEVLEGAPEVQGLHAGGAVDRCLLRHPGLSVCS